MLLASPGPGQNESGPLQVTATIPDLASLTQEIGGDQVAVSSFTKGTQDPHFLEAKPSFIKQLSQADVYVHAGMELEMGWAPELLKSCRNSRVQPGEPGNIDASAAIQPLEIPEGPVDRSHGDVHAQGNPHYLLDPVNGLKVAALIRDRLIKLRPGKKEYFTERHSAFHKRLAQAMAGETLAAKYDVEKLALLMEHGKLLDFLKQQGEEKSIGGWFGRLADKPGTKAVGDHNLYPYFARRFTIRIVGFLEPKPGISPTTRHLGQIVETMKKEEVKMIFAVTYFDPQHAEVVARNTSAKVLPMAHQVGARAGTDDYISFIDYNVRQVAEAVK
jgi:ABC-type Zn uptake system ZnuABC Zn-binding protein ZnuA